MTGPGGRADLDEMIDVLLDNAAKYAGAGATVQVSLTQDADGIRLIVEDSGTRLADDDLARMGTRFWRAGRDATQTGSGLGLAIVAQLMRAAGGRLELDPALRGGLAARLVWDRP